MSLQAIPLAYPVVSFPDPNMLFGARFRGICLGRHCSECGMPIGTGAFLPADLAQCLTARLRDVSRPRRSNSRKRKLSMPPNGEPEAFAAIPASNYASMISRAPNP